MAATETQPDRHVIAFDTSSIPRTDRFEAWREFSRNAILSHQFIAKADRFGGRVNVVAQSSMHMLKIDEAPCEYIRDPSRANDPQPDLLAFYFVRSGEVFIEQDGRSTAIRAGDATVCVGDRPYRLSAPGRHSLLAFKVSRTFLSRPGDFQVATARSFLEAHSIGTMTISMAHGIWSRISSLDAVTTSRLVSTVIDMTETTFGLFAFDEGENSPSMRQSTLRRIKFFVEQNISDDELSPTLVSQALGLSTRYINRLLNEERTTLGRYIWETRLEKALKRLGDPAFNQVSIASIAFSLGFKSQSHFSAAFRDKYGISPSEFRNDRAPK